MATPIQQRFVDAYGQDRYSTSINRLSRIFTGGQNTVLDFDTINTIDPEDLNTFSLTKDSTTDYSTPPVTYNDAVIIGPGIAVVDDVGIHVTELDRLSINDTENYVYYPGDLPGPSMPSPIGEEFNFYIVMYYKYSRGYPPSEAKYYFVKNQTLYVEHLNDFLYLGTAHVQFNAALNDGGGGYFISDVVLVDYIQGYEIIARRNYPVRYPTEAEYTESIDGGWADTSTLSSYIDTSELNPNYEDGGWEAL